MTAKPAAIPSMCGVVARMPYVAAELAIITLFGPGVMYMLTAKPSSDGNVLSISPGP
jgi:hypothetical protein